MNYNDVEEKHGLEMAMLVEQRIKEVYGESGLNDFYDFECNKFDDFIKEVIEESK
jgi:hypothetical protein